MNNNFSNQTIKDLFDTHARNLLALTYGILGDYHAAQDVVQETFMRYYEQRKRGVVVRHPRAWLYRVASNVALNAVRARSHRAEELTADTEALGLPVISPEQKLENCTIAAALNRLSPSDHEMLELRIFDGLTFHKIGELCACSENAAQKRYNRILKHMRKFLEKFSSITHCTARGYGLYEK